MTLFGKLSGAQSAKSRMDTDPDILAEKMENVQLPAGHPKISKHPKGTCPMARLNVVRTSHTPNAETAAIVREAGGLPAMRRFTNRFYELAFADPHLDQFIASHDDPHGERFATWIAERMGDGTPWTAERRTREVHTFVAHGHRFQTAHDRSSAHFAAWHSPKRPEHEWGQHFKLDTCRVWMRLHFWAAREEGVFDKSPAFADYYCRMIGHFVSVYEGSAPPFCRESMRWSENPANIQKYLANGRRMPEIMKVPLQQALKDLPPSERSYTGSKAGQPLWPYDMPGIE